MEARDAAEHPKMQWTVPYNKELPVPQCQQCWGSGTLLESLTELLNDYCICLHYVPLVWKTLDKEVPREKSFISTVYMPTSISMNTAGWKILLPTLHRWDLGSVTWLLETLAPHLQSGAKRRPSFPQPLLGLGEVVNARSLKWEKALWKHWPTGMSKTCSRAVFGETEEDKIGPAFEKFITKADFQTVGC